MGHRLTPKRVEEIEHKYLEEISWNLSNEQGKLLQLLKTKDEITDDWIAKFRGIDDKRKSGEMARGAERVISILFPNTWRPNSTPIGSDFMFETFDAMIHVDIKTARPINKSDHKHSVNIGQNQTSYYSEDRKSYGNLPTVYTIKRGEEKISKLCITFALLIVYDDQQIVKVFLISIPNGKLYKIYREGVIGGGKSKGKSIRFKYKDQKFKKLPNTPPRFKLIYSR